MYLVTFVFRVMEGEIYLAEFYQHGTNETTGNAGPPMLGPGFQVRFRRRYMIFIVNVSGNIFIPCNGRRNIPSGIFPTWDKLLWAEVS